MVPTFLYYFCNKACIFIKARRVGEPSLPAVCKCKGYLIKVCRYLVSLLTLSVEVVREASGLGTRKECA